MTLNSDNLEYAGFWLRVVASLIDSILLGIIIYPLALSIYGKEYFTNTDILLGTWDFLLSWVFPAAAILVFWFARSATPGKMVIGAQIVDERTGGKPTRAQFVVRYLGYYVSAIPLCLGLIWVGFDRRKQGWHDKLARTVVVRPRGRGEPVKFEAPEAMRGTGVVM